jgi:GT2 family glycosyltransferase
MQLIDGCLDSVLAQEGAQDFEVLVVDNASGDASADHVRNKYPSVRVVNNHVNLGFAAGNNVGLRVATGHYLVLLNNDTRVRAGWLQALLEAADSDQSVGAVTAKLVFAEPPHAIQNAGCLLLSDGSGGDRGFGEADTGQYERAEEVFGFCGASALMRREMLQDVGAFDESFFAYYEDIDLSWRMRLRGWKVVYEPRAVVEHFHAGTSQEWSRFFIFHADRNRLFAVLKNGAPRVVLRSFLGFYSRAFANLLATVRGRGAAIDLPAGNKMPRPGRAQVHLKVAASLFSHLPGMLVKRWRIRRNRIVPDTEIARWLYPRDRWDAR